MKRVLVGIALLALCGPGVMARQTEQAPVRLEGTIQEPQKTHHVNPVYPSIARAAGVQGVVLLEATIATSGNVTDVKVLRGIPLLDESAMTAVSQWRYEPTLLNGVPVPVIMTVSVNFILDRATPSPPAGPGSIAAPGSGPSSLPGFVPPGVASPGVGLDRLGGCGSSPNYIDSRLGGGTGNTGAPRLRRWARFPVTYSVDTSAVPADVRQLYEDAGIVARDLWSIATGGRVGTLRSVSPGAGDIRVRIVPMREGGSFAQTAAMPLTGPEITHALIEIERYPLDAELIGIGQQRPIMLQVINTLAHEIGHALGLNLHSSDDDDLMSHDGNFVMTADQGRDPRSFVTAADRNTLLHAYCQ